MGFCFLCGLFHKVVHYLKIACFLAFRSKGVIYYEPLLWVKYMEKTEMLAGRCTTWSIVREKVQLLLENDTIRCWTFTHTDTFHNYGEEEITWGFWVCFRDWQYLGTVDFWSLTGWAKPTVTRYNNFFFAFLREFHSLLKFSLQPRGFWVQLHLKLEDCYAADVCAVAPLPKTNMEPNSDGVEMSLLLN